jgi:CRP-like cAMP-binding protein
VRRILKEFDLFKELEPSVQENLPHIVKYQASEAHHVIFEQGDDPDLCYIILSGEVTVWTKKHFRDHHHHHDHHEHHHHHHHLSMADGEDEEALKHEKHGSLLGEYRRPPLTSASILAREKCTVLAKVLRAAAKEAEANGRRESRVSSAQPRERLGSRCSAYGGRGRAESKETPNAQAAADTEPEVLEDSILQATNTPVATLGAGTIFGELALMNDHPRNATVSCYTNCEFLVMERKDFDSILKAAMVKARDAKLQFIREIVPGVRNLPLDDGQVDKFLYYFAKESVPRNHFFLEQGEIMDGSIYFIWQGAVESYHQESTGGLRRKAIMLEGSIFAAVPQGSRSPMSLQAQSTPCEVLRVKPENRKHFPDCVIRSLREVLDKVVSRRSAQCLLPLSPMGSTLASSSLHPRQQLEAQKEQAKKHLPQARSGKIPRPLSGKIPQLLNKPEKAPFGGMQRKPRTQSSLPSFRGLFQREATEVDYEAFELGPGETIAITAKLPRKRVQKPMMESSSLPRLT